MDALLFTAAETFHAARRLANLPAGHRARAVHGHGFGVKIHADLRERGDLGAGTETRALGDVLRQASAALDYQDLNAFIAEPGDLGIATWLGERLVESLHPGRLAALGLNSTAWQGVTTVAEAPTRGWRRYRFEAAHRLPSVPEGHPCGRMHGHGFEVTLHADLAPDDPTGLSGYDKLDAAWAPLARQLHHSCLNLLSGLENPTSELLCLWLWQRLEPELPGLRQVMVRETRTAGCCYDGQRFRIWKDLFFESALRFGELPEADPWHGLHGHSYALRLMLGAPLDEVLGWTVDFGDVKVLFKPVYARLDHFDLSTLPGLQRPGVAELLHWIAGQVADVLPQIDGIALNPTPGCGASLSLAGADHGLTLPAL
ncbi:6-carboxytetrahydropterin synthase [Thiorhodovibrio frisius]|uniref:6-carboxy-5,6,7,8-tetrahydropterin synthase n=1 Tax=Thiorhodovibrio frisius TaxID=631362 RepID=H8Z4H3_9GAMM|nr:6-carboxytetrahydropterin synthase [Thiorhodovibrio frisius]EIC20230.1 6-pyruvoyl-tetrahydropterin synthase [Thiorhodovibrio frisius]WPL20967.1 6-carboxy-5,6,7,8-tetrahydropterin synthase [Thiorhodovibrio frisius]